MPSPGVDRGDPEMGSPTTRRDTNPRKRPASWETHAQTAVAEVSGNSNFNRPAKKRAPRACISCRDRKVRCDVISGGHPCTNCRLDNVSCILKESNRGKHNSANHYARARTASLASVARPSPPSTSDIDADTTVSVPTARSAPAAINVPPTGSGTGTSTQLPHCGGNRNQAQGDEEEAICDDKEGEVEEEQHVGGQAATEQMNAPSYPAEEFPKRQPLRGKLSQTRREQHQRHTRRGSTPCSASSAPPANPSTSDYLVALAFEGQDKAATAASRRHSFTAEYSTGTTQNQPMADQDRQDTQHSMPWFIRPHPPHLDADDMQYLERKDCFAIPDEKLRSELIRIYVFVVYPFMPAVDLGKFLGAITGEEQEEKISLLLFQAIMFACVTFIDVAQLKRRGFESKRAARRVFFNRVKLLYSLDYESDRLTLVQSLLLMTYWYDSDSDDKHTWYWMGIALTTAQVEGLHRDVDEPQRMTRVGRLRRRIWWSCLIRDRLLGLGIRRPSRIREDECSIRPLTVEDFDLTTPTAAVSRLLATTEGQGPDSSSRRAMAMICVDLSKLCVVIGHILHSQYTIGSTPQQEGSNYLRKAIVRPKSSEEQKQSFLRCDTALDEWLQNCAPESKYEPGVDRNAAQGDKSMLRLHQALLYMNYLTALGALHRPQVFYSGSDRADLGRKADSRRKVTEAAVAITKLAFDLQRTNQMCYSPTSSIPAFLSAALIHLLNTRSSNEETRNISIGRFCQCLDALHQLQTMYAAADQAVHIVNNVLENAGLMVPILGVGKPAPRLERATVGGRPGGGPSGGPRNTRLFPDMWPSRVASAYPSPAAAGSHDENSHDGNSVPATAPLGVVDGPITEDLNHNMVRVAPAVAPAVPSYDPFTMPLFMNTWTVGGIGTVDRNNPLPTDGMPGSQFDLDAWYDVGDILDPALMNFEVEADFVPAEAMAM